MASTSTRQDEPKTKPEPFQPEGPAFYQRSNYIPGHLQAPTAPISGRANFIPGPSKEERAKKALSTTEASAKEADQLSKSFEAGSVVPSALMAESAESESSAPTASEKPETEPTTRRRRRSE